MIIHHHLRFSLALNSSNLSKISLGFHSVSGLNVPCQPHYFAPLFMADTKKNLSQSSMMHFK